MIASGHALDVGACRASPRHDVAPPLHVNDFLFSLRIRLDNHVAAFMMCAPSNVGREDVPPGPSLLAGPRRQINHELLRQPIAEQNTASNGQSCIEH